jgi:hypothetical protein
VASIYIYEGAAARRDVVDKFAWGNASCCKRLNVSRTNNEARPEAD